MRERCRFKLAADDESVRSQFVQEQGVDCDVPCPNVEGAERAGRGVLRKVEAGQDVVEPVGYLRVRREQIANPQ